MSTAVLLLAHGTPDSPADVPAYMQNITGGRPIPPEVMQEVQHRYTLIGRSPLTDITLRQAARLRDALNLPVYAAMRNWHPFIADVVANMLADGITRIVALCLAPHSSRTSVGLYRKALEQASAGRLAIDFVEHWHSEPLLIDSFAEKLSAVRANANAVIFTAHSVPCRTICADATGAGDLYSAQTKHTAELVARKVGLGDNNWFFAFQSQGMSGGTTWIGPTVEATIDALQAVGRRRVIIQPIGFVCDHVEVLYDIDIAFKQYAAARGIELSRTESLNDSPTFIAALAHIARTRLAAL
ncbi:MAG TPA: ferrochelatase [Terriglobales bacterium]|nr:ferrochelatase [Terriglobales bacterium]